MTWYNPLTWFKKKPFKRWPSTTVTYCFREMVEGNRFPLPIEYYDLVRECADEWTEFTVINLVEADFFDEPQPQIVLSLGFMKKSRLGWGFFPGKDLICGDINLSVRDWSKEHTRAYFKTIILHEFGHALGLRHSRSIHSLMHKYPKAKEIHRFDIKNLNEGYRDE